MISTEQIKELQQRAATLGRCINIEAKRSEVESKTQRTLAPDFWDDPKEAEKFLKELSGVKFWVTGYDKVASAVEDLNVLYEFAKESLDGADDEQTAEQYLFMCEYLEQKGYRQYEISNFSKSGAQSRHNLKYWRLQEYLGIGPSAHSFVENERFYYPRDLKAFINCPQTASDGSGGDNTEKLMLSLRLCEGADLTEYVKEIPENLKREINNLQNAELVLFDGKTLKLTPKGMLVSNSIITDITELIYENF